MKKVKTLEITNELGKIKLTLEGEVTTHFLKIVSVLEHVMNEIVEGNTKSDSKSGQGVGSQSSSVESFVEKLENLTIKDRVLYIIKAAVRHGWCNSREVQELYEHYVNKKINLSTVSTYLSRLEDEGYLERRGSRANYEYRIVPEKIEEIPEIELPKIKE